MPLRGLPSSMLKSPFKNGLRLDIQVKLLQLEPVGFMGKMRATQKIEEKQMALETYHIGLLPNWLKPFSSIPLAGQHAATHVTTTPTMP